MCKEGDTITFRRSLIPLCQRISERICERGELYVKLLPVVFCAGVDRLPNLACACGPHDTFVFVESKALLLEGQAAMLEQGTNPLFGVVDHRLIDDTVNSTG